MQLMVRSRKSIETRSDICMPNSPLNSLCMDQMVFRECTPNSGLFSLYAMGLLEWQRLFDPSQLLFIKSEDFYGDTPRLMKETSEFLSLDDFDWVGATEKRYNIVNPKSLDVNSRDLTIATKESQGLQVGVESNAEKYAPIPKDVHRRLSAAYYPYNLLLGQMLGKDKTWGIPDD